MIDEGVAHLGNAFRGLTRSRELQGDGTIGDYQYSVQFEVNGDVISTEPCPQAITAFRVAYLAKKEFEN